MPTTDFRIIPVLDILDSTAVHAKKGERNNYKPLQSLLFPNSNPITVLKTLKKKYNFDEFYIADLDAIIKNKPNLNLIIKISEIPGIKLMLDPGIRKKEDLLIYSEIKLSKLIIGLETIESLKIIDESLKIFGENRIIISIDMYNGYILSKIKNLENKNPLDVIKIIKKFNVKEIILLDLFRVGQKFGGIPQIYLEIQKNYVGNILVGGGIKDFNDIIIYQKNNFSGIILATALYDGSINIEEIKNSN